MTSEEPGVDSDSMEVDVIGTRPETSAQVRVRLRLDAKISEHIYHVNADVSLARLQPKIH